MTYLAYETSVREQLFGAETLVQKSIEALREDCYREAAALRTKMGQEGDYQSPLFDFVPDQRTYDEGQTSQMAFSARRQKGTFVIGKLPDPKMGEVDTSVILLIRDFLDKDGKTLDKRGVAIVNPTNEDIVMMDYSGNGIIAVNEESLTIVSLLLRDANSTYDKNSSFLSKKRSRLSSFWYKLFENIE
jgi:hypothetical protein